MGNGRPAAAVSAEAATRVYAQKLLQRRCENIARTRRSALAAKGARNLEERTRAGLSAILAANTSMRGVEVKNVRRKDFDTEKRIIHIRTARTRRASGVILLNDSAFDAVRRMLRRADLLGHADPSHYLWCASQHHKLDPTRPAQVGYRMARVTGCGGRPGLRFHDLRDTVVTRLFETDEPDHVIESIAGHLSRAASRSGTQRHRASPSFEDLRRVRRGNLPVHPLGSRSESCAVSRSPCGPTR